MLPFLKSSSRTVHHFQEHDNNNNNYADIDEESAAASTSLTVWRKSLVLSCSGFTVIASDGTLAYRVDNYTARPEQIVLMDGSGNPLFTICRRKKLGLMDNNWFVYEGELGKHRNINSSKKPIFCVRKKLNIFTQAKLNVLACVYCKITDKTYTYIIEGSYTRRSCKILDVSEKVVGEIRKKESTLGSGVSFGLEVFHLVVRPGFDSRFGMAIVLLLDQMFS